MKMKYIFILIALVCVLFANEIAASDFSKMQADIEISLKGGKKGVIKVPCNYWELVNSGKETDIKEINSCMLQRKEKNVRYYVDQYEIMYRLITKNNNKGLEILLKDKLWDPAIVLKSMGGRMLNAVFILDKEPIIQNLVYEDYISQNTKNYWDMPLLAVAVMKGNTEGVEIVYKHTRDDLKLRHILFSLDFLIEHHSEHIGILYNFAVDKLGSKYITNYVIITSLVKNNTQLLKHMADIYSQNAGYVNMFKDTLLQYLGSDYGNNADFSKLYDIIKNEIDTNDKNEILTFLIKNDVRDEKLISSVLNSLTLEDIRDNFNAKVLLDSVNAYNSEYIGNLIFKMIHKVKHSGNLRVNWGNSTISLFAYWAAEYSSFNGDRYLKIAKMLLDNGSSLNEVIISGGKQYTAEDLIPDSALTFINEVKK